MTQHLEIETCLEALEKKAHEMEDALADAQDREMEAKRKMFELIDACVEWKELYTRTRRLAELAIGMVENITRVMPPIQAELTKVSEDVQKLMKEHPLANGK